MTTDNVSGDFPVKVLPKIVVFGVGGAGINSVNNMILSGLDNAHPQPYSHGWPTPLP